MMNQTQEDVNVKVSASATQATLIESDSISLHELQTNAPTNTNINNGRWTDEEHRHFLAAARQYGRRWKTIAATLGTRTATQVRTHALKFYAKIAKARKKQKALLDEEGLTLTPNSSLGSRDSAEFGSSSNECETNPAHATNNGHWSADEHRLFLSAVLQHGKGWKEISATLKTRSAVQVRTHAQKFYAKLVKANEVTDDDRITKTPMTGGLSSSVSVVSISASPSPSVSLNINTNMGRWSEEEHRLFLVAALEHGRNWKKIATVVESRTAVQVRTHAQKWYFRHWARQKLRAEACL